MPRINIHLRCPLKDSFRVQQIAGMFDLPVEEELTENFVAELPSLDEPWDIGVIVGPSGSGKTAIARQAFGPQLYQPGDWPTDRAVIDGFGDLPIRDIIGVLTAVGFSSPRSWLKPFAVLSNGEKFRCELARALLVDIPGVWWGRYSCLPESGSAGHSCPAERIRIGSGGQECPPLTDSPADKNVRPTIRQCPAPENGARAQNLNQAAPLVVFDEFTSVVDRTVARIGSAAVARAIRNGRINRRFVAVTCHYDVVPWLQPDWVLDMASGLLARGRLWRPSIRLRIHRAGREAWLLFRRHHYLSGKLHRAAKCFVGT
ncbi:MAG TPA: ABC transporter ATP-binding protein, partial [Tepidisphaeraceae bacterium]|nr:ABC transporter ATP-binding protein [Tepidisphaeraceae bacterium]